MIQTHGTWGRRIVTWEDDKILVALLFLRPKKRCSWHLHRHQYNQFTVIAGKLEIKTDIGPGGQRNFTTISHGQTFTVQPGVKHEFRTLEVPTVVEEIAYVKRESTDIHREQLGGDL